MWMTLRNRFGRENGSSRKRNSPSLMGLRTNVGTPNFEIIQRYVDDIVTVSEEAIVKAMREIWQTMKIIVEPSAAVPLAAILDSGAIDVAGRRIGIILTGGNVDLDALPWTGQ